MVFPLIYTNSIENMVFSRKCQFRQLSSDSHADSPSYRSTLPFNGYRDQVSSLYSGMHLKVNF
jgi:hypothetical protein